MTKRVGVFGGTFDPPHNGHLILAADAAEQMALDEILWVITPLSPHKLTHEITSVEHRQAMLNAAIAGNPRFTRCDIDINRQPPYYAADTVRLIRQCHPQCQLFYLVGGDSLRTLPSWHQPQVLVDACDAICAKKRPGSRLLFNRLEKALPGIIEKLVFIESPITSISSTEIRDRCNTKREFRYFIPLDVYDYILKNQLYQ